MRNTFLWPIASLLAGGLLFFAGDGGPARAAEAPDSGSLTLHARSCAESAKGSGQWRPVDKTLRWNAAKTAVIVCDMWDRHWCKSASARVAELAPRVNAFVGEARKRGALIVHAPSNCMAAYQDHPARKRAEHAPQAKLPEFLGRGGDRLATEKGNPWPLDQSDGGCNDQPQCVQGWFGHRQIDAIKISAEDAISDSGVEIGNLFVERGIENVMLLGVHTNMCVLGRPFGLRNMVRCGKNVVLVRDLTDTMYNARKRPFVSHFRGTELMIAYIEQHVCPTITSGDLLGGRAFHFAADERPHVVLVSYEDEYHADETLPRFAQHLSDQFGCRCSALLGDRENGVVGLEELTDADVLVLYVRRHALPTAQMAAIRDYLAAGKPLVALRTSCHAFDIKAAPPAGLQTWPAFDHEVLGGNYHNHYGAGPPVEIRVAGDAAAHPILSGISLERWTSAASLYRTSPLDSTTTTLLIGQTGEKSEPVAWTHMYHGGRVFFTSLGSVDDFQTPQFCTMLVNAIYWAMGKPVAKQRRVATEPDRAN